MSLTIKEITDRMPTNCCYSDDFQYYEATDTITRKYLWVFNEDEENITEMVAHVLNRRISKSKKFSGAIIVRSEDSYFTHIISNELFNKNYRNENDIRFAYFVDTGKI